MKLSESVSFFTENYHQIKHIKDYINQIKWLIEDVGDKKITEIADDDIRDYLNKKYPNNNTYNKRLIIIRTYFSFFVRRKIISKNPCDYLEAKKLTQAEIAHKHQPKDLPRDLLIKILHRMKQKSYQHYLILLLLANTGMRPCEALAIKKQHLQDNIIYLETTKTGQPRYVFLESEISIILATYAHAHDSVWLFPYYLDSTQPCTYDNFKYHFDKIAKGLKHPVTNKQITPYMLRHTYATDRACLLEPVELMQLMGHRDFKTTLIYIHRSKQRLSKINDKVAHLALII